MGLRYGVIAAMPEEIEPFLELSEKAYPIEYNGYRGNLVELPGGTTLKLFACGIGKVKAAAVTQAVSAYVDCIINVGTACGLDPILEVGDIVLSSRVSQVDYQFREREEVLPSSRLLTFIQSAIDRESIDGSIYTGAMATADKFITERTEKAGLYASGFHSYDMESAAVGEVSKMNSKPFCSVRIISDTAVGNNSEDFERNYKAVSHILANIMYKLFTKISACERP